MTAAVERLPWAHLPGRHDQDTHGGGGGLSEAFDLITRAEGAFGTVEMSVNALGDVRLEFDDGVRQETIDIGGEDFARLGDILERLQPERSRIPDGAETDGLYDEEWFGPEDGHHVELFGSGVITITWGAEDDEPYAVDLDPGEGDDDDDVQALLDAMEDVMAELTAEPEEPPADTAPVLPWMKATGGEALSRRPATRGPTVHVANVAAGPATLAGLQRRWQREVNRTVRRWRAEVMPLQQASAERQVEAAVHEQNPDAIVRLAVSPFGAELLLEAMRAMAAAGAASVLAEARAAGVRLDPPPPVAAVSLADWARVTAELLAAGYVSAVVREALRLLRPGATAGGVVDGVRAYLKGLTDRAQRDTIGGALTRAQNLGRMAVYEQGRPAGVTVQLVADETLDERTCGPCERVDGMVLPTPEAAALAYGGAGYLFCEGKERCRGTVRGVWSDERDRADALLSELVAHLPGKHDQKSHGRKRGGGAGKRRAGTGEGGALADTVDAARALPDDSPNWHRLTGGASGAGVRLAVLDDGRRVVRKQAPDWGSDEPRTCADAEELAGLTGAVLDAGLAGVHRDETDVVWIEHAAGKTLGELQDHNGRAPAAFDRWRASKPAMRMGLLDVLTGNGDRNDGNLIIDGDRVVGIDHAFAFEMIGYQHGTPHPDDLARMGGEHAPAGHFIERDDNGRNHWRDNPLTPGDVTETRRRLETLRKAYNKRGRGRWLDNALLLLDQLAEHARGTESIYG